MRDPVEAYFTELRDIRATGGGVAETSYYGALATLLTEIGRGLKPRVRAVSQLKNLGAGAPDFGLFTQQQFAHVHDEEALSGQIPARGDLGEFGPGQMVREFNDVCFNEAVGVVHGPVKTQFGYHLIEVTKRED